MFPQPPIAKNDTADFVVTTTPKTISASLNDYARSGTLNTSSLLLSGSTNGPGYSWATSSNGTVVLTTTTPGTYTVYYTIGADIVAAECPTNIRSNKAKITARVYPECYLEGGTAIYCLGILTVGLNSIGPDAGPFDIYTNADGFCNPIATDVSRIDLLIDPGYVITFPGGATIVRIKSTGRCLNYIDIPITNCTTTTTSLLFT